MIKKIRAGVLLLFFLLLSFEACKAGDAEKEAGTKGWKEAADAAENEEQVKKSSSDTTCYTLRMWKEILIGQSCLTKWQRTRIILRIL